MKVLFLMVIALFLMHFLSAQESTPKIQKQDYQIYLTRPVKSIKHIMYEKNYVPIQGTISEDKKSIIMKNYEPGSKVRVKVEYEDGTTDEFVKSPCYIDPVIT